MKSRRMYCKVILKIKKYDIHIQDKRCVHDTRKKVKGNDFRTGFNFNLSELKR